MQINLYNLPSMERTKLNHKINTESFDKPQHWLY